MKSFGADQAATALVFRASLTYYPEHQKILPEQIEVRVSAQGECADEPVRSSFLVTPYGIYAASGSLPYDEEGVG